MGTTPSRSVITEKAVDTSSDDLLLVRKSDGKAYDINSQTFLYPSEVKIMTKYLNAGAGGNYYIKEKLTLDVYKVVSDGDCDTKYILGWQRNAPTPQSPSFEVKDKFLYDTRCRGYVSTLNDSLRISASPDNSLYAISNNTPIFDSTGALPDYYYFQFFTGYYLSISGAQLVLSKGPFLWKYGDGKLSNSDGSLFIAKDFSCTAAPENIAVMSVVNMLKTWLIYNVDAGKYIGLSIDPTISAYDALQGAKVSFWVKEYNWINDGSGDWLRAATGLGDRGVYTISFVDPSEFYLISEKDGRSVRLGDNQTLSLRSQFGLSTLTLDYGNFDGSVGGVNFQNITLATFLSTEYFLKSLSAKNTIAIASDGFVKSTGLGGGDRRPFYTFVYSYSPGAYRLTFGGLIPAIRSSMDIIAVSLNGVPIPTGSYSIARGDNFFDKTGVFSTNDTRWTYDDNKFVVNKSPYNTTLLNLDIKDGAPDVIDLKCSPFDDNCTTSVPVNNKLVGYATDVADKIGDLYNKPYCYDLLGNAYICNNAESYVNFIKHEPEPTNMNMFRKDFLPRYPPTEAIIAPSCPMPDNSNVYYFMTFSESNGRKYAQNIPLQYAGSDDRNRGCCSGKNTWKTSIKRYNEDGITTTKVRDNLYKMPMFQYLDVLENRKEFYPNATNIDGTYIETGYNPGKTIVAQGEFRARNTWVVQTSDGSRYAFPIRSQDWKDPQGGKYCVFDNHSGFIPLPICQYTISPDFKGYHAEVPRSLSRILVGKVYKGEYYFLTEDNAFYDPNITSTYVHEGKIAMDPGYCSSSYCPFSNECKSKYPETINSYCADVDDLGYPRLNNDPDCLQWCTENKDRCYGIGDAFCRKYPDHPACGCANYTNSEEYKSVLDQFVTNEDTKSSSIIPSPYCWAPVCTQSNDVTNKNRPVLTSLLSRAKCDGIDLTFCNMYTKVSGTGGNVRISDNVYTQFCGNRENKGGDTKGDTKEDTKGDTGTGGSSGSGATGGDTKSPSGGGDTKSPSSGDTKETKSVLDTVKDYLGLGGTKTDTTTTSDTKSGDTTGDTAGDTKNKSVLDSIKQYLSGGDKTADTTDSSGSDTGSSGGSTLSTTNIIIIVVVVVVIILILILYLIFRKK